MGALNPTHSLAGNPLDMQDVLQHCLVVDETVTRLVNSKFSPAAGKLIQMQ